MLKKTIVQSSRGFYYFFKNTITLKKTANTTDKNQKLFEKPSFPLRNLNFFDFYRFEQQQSISFFYLWTFDFETS